MKLLETPIRGVVVIEPELQRDERGVFSRVFCQRELGDVLDGRGIVQANLSENRRRATLRGLHYQRPPHAEGKLIRCVRGAILDVAVDLRSGSETYLRAFEIRLSAEDGRMVYLPEGLAHGFQTLEDESDLLYLHTAYHEPRAAAGIRYDDGRLGISWPLPPAVVSPRDLALPTIASLEQDRSLPLRVE